jgi:phosphorylcholine metabolism protein LicD
MNHIYQIILFFLFLFMAIYLYYEFYLIENFVPFDIINSNTNLTELESIIFYIKNLLETNHIDYWISRGTLLGAVRHSNIIPWSKSLNSEFCTSDENTDKLNNLMEKIKNDGYQIQIDVMGNYVIFSNSNSNVKVHIILYTIGSNQIIKLKNNKENDYFTFNELYPIKQYQFSYFKLYGPNNPTPYLNRIYGPDWKIIGKMDKKQFPIDIDINSKPYLWIYWDNLNGAETPVYISLCKESVIKNCSNSFNVVFLNNENIMNFLPELTPELKEELNLNSNKIKIAHKVDLYRIMLLYKYGGMYIDADVIVLKDPIEVYEKTKQYDFVGFGCTGTICMDGYMKPSNWLLASRPYSILMRDILKELIEKFKKIKLEPDKQIQYHEVGKMVIWDKLNNLTKSDKYSYYHYPSRMDGSRDIYGKWITTHRVFSSTPIHYENENDMLFMVFYNSEMPENVKMMTRDELLHSDMNISKFYRKALA